jgi:hypothetical protein
LYAQAVSKLNGEYLKRYLSYFPPSPALFEALMDRVMAAKGPNQKQCALVLQALDDYALRLQLASSCGAEAEAEEARRILDVADGEDVDLDI